jgi:hypothetical protein
VTRARSKRDRLLEGEDPESLRPQDTRHWISVYREMIAFKDDLLERVTGDLVHVSAAAKTDLNDDITLIDSQLKRYRNAWTTGSSASSSWKRSRSTPRRGPSPTATARSR